MKKYAALILLLVATTCFARTRDWKPATVIDLSETKVSGPLLRDTITLHYTVETYDTIYFLEYNFHPLSSGDTTGQHNKNSAPGVVVNSETKIAIEGKHAYVLDNTGVEVKMHILRKAKQ